MINLPRARSADSRKAKSCIVIYWALLQLPAISQHLATVVCVRALNLLLACVIPSQVAQKLRVYVMRTGQGLNVIPDARQGSHLPIAEVELKGRRRRSPTRNINVADKTFVLSSSGFFAHG